MESPHEIETSSTNSNQQVDVLTKRGTSPHKIMEILQEGVLKLE